ncbi:MAG: hypothetical protein AABW81_03915, partial [Nanoarchaeota archaeon]
FLDKEVLIEEEALGNDFSIGIFVKNGYNNVIINDYKKYQYSLYDLIERVKNIKEEGRTINPLRPPKIMVKKKLINKSQIASIQSLEDISQGINFEKVFE